MNAAPYQVRTHNASTESENRMHSDDVARQFGFKGGLVPGVTVFSHMTRPMVARYGEAWLARGTAEVTFGKPAYEGELLTINTADNNDASHTLTCLNEQGVELARMSAALPLATTKPDARSNLAPAPPQAERPTVTWDLMAINQPFPALAWSPTREENFVWCDDSRDDLPLYREGATPLLHPGFILRAIASSCGRRISCCANASSSRRGYTSPAASHFLQRRAWAPSMKCVRFPR